MKPEPLKGKERKVSHIDDRSISNAIPLYHKKDIASAVEWLKKKLKDDGGNTPTDVIIDKAFEDVVKKD